MSKTIRRAQLKRGADIKKKLAVIKAKLERAYDLIEHSPTQDGENLRLVVADAIACVADGIEFYCTWL